MDQPPSSNPLKQMYEEWSAKTPCVTRNSLIGIVILYILSFFFDADVTLGNIPYFSLMHLEIYRIILAPAVGNSLITILLMVLFYPVMGSRLESSLGSAGYLFHLFIITLATNLLFDGVCFVIYAMGSAEALFWSCSGFWTVLFAMIVMECMQTPDAPRRLLCFPIDIPSKYYPLALYGFFSLFSGPQLDFAVSMIVGYMSSKGLLDRFNISTVRLTEMESSGCLASLSRSSGWIPVNSALGISVYTGEARESDAGSSTSWLRGASNSQASMGQGQAEAFPGSGRTLTNTSTLSAMWGGGGGSYPSGGMTDSGGSRESRQDLAARRLQAMSQGTETGYGTSKSPFFAGASAPPTSSDSYLISTLMVKDMGYSEKDAKRALRESGESIEGAIEQLAR